jgi:hypothetical protein
MDIKVFLLVFECFGLRNHCSASGETKVKDYLYYCLVVLLGKRLKILILTHIKPIRTALWVTFGMSSWSHKWSVSNWNDFFGFQETNQFRLWDLRVQFNLVDHWFDFAITE